MATDAAKGFTSEFMMSEQDTEEIVTNYEDAYETYVTTIPRDGSLTKEECIKRHEAFAKEFQYRLVEVAKKASNLKILVSFVNAVDNDRPSCEILHESNKANIVTKSVIYSRTPLGNSQNIDVYDGKDAWTENEHYSYNLLKMENDIDWISVPFLAVERNNTGVVEMCMKTGVDLETFRNFKGQTLLSHALKQTKVNHDIINILLKCIGVNIGANDGETPVMTCIQNENISVKERFALLEILIDAGADVMTRSFHLGTALHEFFLSLASEINTTKLTGWKSVIDVFLTKGVDINAIDFFGHTALMRAITRVPPTGLEDSDVYDQEARSNIIDARRCKIEIIEYLLQKGANLEVVAISGYTALCIALANQNVDVVHTLVKHGANVNHLTKIKTSPAHVICCESDWSEEGDIESILLPSLRILLNAGLNINIKGIDDSTVLHFAAAKFNHNICEFLIKAGADIAASDYLQRQPLHMAVRNANNMVMETLINLGADIEAKDIHGETPLTHACLHGNTNAVQFLIKSGADCNTRGDLGIQPIHIAAENGDSLMMSILQTTVCDLSAPDASGSTPLHYAASDGNHDTVQYLLSQNISKKCKDYQGLAPLDLAVLRGEYMVSTLLADSTFSVKFGNLPTGLFPNRPLRKIHELDNYVDEIAEPLKTIGDLGEGIGKAILDTPGLGRLDLDKGESYQIYTSITQLCLEIVERIGELDPLFQCKLMNAGSSFERVKIGYPDEFDFVCHMEKISAFVEKVENVDTPVFCQIIMKDSLPPDLSRFCLRSKKYLNASDILRHFCRLTRIASYDILKRKHQNIYAGLLLLDESADILGESPIPVAKLQGFTVSWRGPIYKHIDISIDINPVLYTKEWPSKAVRSSILLPSIQEEGMYLIPKHCSKICLAGVVENVTLDSDFWRYSTNHIEALVMKRLPQEARDSYMLCKAFRLEPLTCSIQMTKTEGYMSETTCLKKLLPIEAQRKMVTFGNDRNCGDYSETYNDCDEFDDNIQDKEKWNEADNEIMSDSENDDIVQVDEKNGHNRSEHEIGVRTMQYSNMLRHTPSGTFTVFIGGVPDDDTHEITAENVYHHTTSSLFFFKKQKPFYHKQTLSPTVSCKVFRIKFMKDLKMQLRCNI